MIEESGKVRFGQALKDYFRGYVEFRGRSTRAGYWWMQLVLGLVALIFVGWFIWALVDLFSHLTRGFNLAGFVVPLVLLLVFGLGTFLPTLALRVRRFRDAGLRGRGTAVLIGLQVAISGTVSFAQYSQFSSVIDHAGNLAAQTPKLSSFALLLVFISYALSLFMFVVTVLPSDVMTTKSKNGFWRFFLREKVSE